MQKGREYNMKIAIFIVRNRLTFYDDGGLIDRSTREERSLKSSLIATLWCKTCSCMRIA